MVRARTSHWQSFVADGTVPKIDVDGLCLETVVAKMDHAQFDFIVMTTEVVLLTKDCVFFVVFESLSIGCVVYHTIVVQCGLARSSEVALKVVVDGDFDVAFGSLMTGVDLVHVDEGFARPNISFFLVGSVVVYVGVHRKVKINSNKACELLRTAFCVRKMRSIPCNDQHWIFLETWTNVPGCTATFVSRKSS